MDAPPAADKPIWNEVMPPDKIQISENDTAKLEKRPMRRESSCA